MKAKQKKAHIDLTQLKPVDMLTDEEQLLHEALTNGQFEFQNDSKTITKYAEIFTNSAKQRKAISLRLPKQDYFAIKAKAMQLGLPYQALINSLIHRYVNGEYQDTNQRTKE